ncbi:MAG: carbamoyltransferase C-terminal domain-containing protein [Candidatus Gracilibacteria bacterium]
MDLFISSNYNVTDEKWSIVVKYGDTIKAVSLERITRIKYFPAGSFFGKKNYYSIFMDALGGIIKDIDLKKIENIFVLNFPFPLESLFINKKIQYSEIRDHHLLHAYSAFYASGFSESAVLIMDGAGYEESYDKEICYSIWRFNNGEVKNEFIGEIKKKDFKLGIGFLYALHTLIFKIGEGAIMGLSSYGDATYYDDIELFGGDFLLSDTYTKFFEKYKTSGGNLEDLTKIMHEIYGIEKQNKESLNHSHLKHVAAKIQSTTQEVILELAQKVKELAKSDNLCIAGGVGLNILGNTAILNRKLFKDIFIQPASDDSGLSLGGVYYLERKYSKNLINKKIHSYGIGREYDNKKIEEVLCKYQSFLKYTREKNIISTTNNLLVKKKIIGFFQGGSEFGPRSLGFRSILARPDSLSVRNRINKIKNREYWRPLAPVILEEELDNYFLTETFSPFMLLNGKIKTKKFSQLIGVSHCDTTARYQTVSLENNPFLYGLLREFYKETDIPVLINTSLNNHNEPIVETIDDAVKMFLSTELDKMIIGDFLLSKDKVYNEFEFSKTKEYNKFFNSDMRVKQGVGRLIFVGMNDDFESSFHLGKIYFENKSVKMSLSLVQESVIGNNKNILVNFESRVDRGLQEGIMRNVFASKDKISKLLLFYYNDFINEHDIRDIIVTVNNFIL